MTGRIAQINVSAGGVPKRPVRTARVTGMGIEGDGHRNRRLHGGPDRALCLFSLELIEALQAEGHRVEPGALGENLTVAELDWSRVRPDDVFRLGETVLIQITQFTRPCGRRFSTVRTRGSPRRGTRGGAASTRGSSCRARSRPETGSSASGPPRR